MRVKTKRHNLDAVRRDLLWAHGRAEAFEADGRVPREATSYVRAWYAPRAAAELLHFRGLVDEVASSDVLRVILARAARSARRTTHFDLDFPREPQVEPVLVPQAPPHVPSRRGGAEVPPPLHARHARPARGVRGGAGT